MAITESLVTILDATKMAGLETVTVHSAPAGRT
jgi:hypothetical protein